MKMLAWSICNLCAHTESKDPYFRGKILFRESFSFCPQCGTYDTRSLMSRSNPAVDAQETKNRSDNQAEIVKNICRAIRDGKFIRKIHKGDPLDEAVVQVSDSVSALFYYSWAGDDRNDSVYLTNTKTNEEITIRLDKTQERNLMCAYEAMVRDGEFKGSSKTLAGFAGASSKEPDQ